MIDGSGSKTEVRDLRSPDSVRAVARGFVIFAKNRARCFIYIFIRRVLGREKMC